MHEVVDVLANLVAEEAVQAIEPPLEELLAGIFVSFPPGEQELEIRVRAHACEDIISAVATDMSDTGELDLHKVAVAPGNVEVRRIKASAFAKLFGGSTGPTRIGRFEVLRRVGQGGMGVVYAAWDPQLHRNVALKVVRPDGGQTETRASVRMLQEARAAARLSHPNVVTVYEVGEDEGGIHIAMELLDAITLRAHVQSLGEDWRAILRSYLAAGAGLAAAHGAGLVHRDFKPDNVLVATDGRVCVTDFGLAVDRDDEDVEGSGCTPGPAGTLPYMAPEQLRGQPTGPAADQFSFCVALWEALWGTRPFAGDTPQALSAAIEAGEIVEPAQDRRVPATLTSALRRGLSADPGERHRDMEILLSTLGRFLRPRRFWIPLVAGSVASATALLLVLQPADSECTGGSRRLATIWSAGRRAAIGDAFAATSLSFADDSRREVERRLDAWAPLWIAAHHEACAATRIRGEATEDAMDRRMSCLELGLGQVGALVDLLTHADADVVRASGTAVSNLPNPADCSREGGRMKWPVDPDARARLASILAEIDRAAALRWAGKAGDGLAAIEAAIREAEEAGHDPTLAYGLLERGHLETDLARHDLAATSFDAAISRAGTAGDHELIARAAIALARAVGTGQGKPADGQVLARAAAIAVAGAGATPELRAPLLTVESRLAHLRGDYVAAYEHAAAALRLFEQERGTDDLVTAEALQVLGNAAMGRGDLQAAEEAHRRALAIRERLLGREHPLVADALQNVGAALIGAGKIDDAESCYRRALAIREAVFDAAHPAIADAVSNLGHVAAMRDEPEVALAEFQRALAIFETAYGPDHPRVANTLSNMAGAAQQSGALDGARAYDERALEIYLRVHGEQHPHVAITLTRLGEVHQQQGRIVEAIGLLSRALAIREATLGKDHPRIGRSLYALAMAEIESGQRAEAVRRLERALGLVRGVEGQEGLVEEIALALEQAGRP